MYNSILSDEFYQKEKNKDLNIIDVREVFEYTGGHIPEAISLPLSELGQRYTELDPQLHYYVICHTGSRSTSGCAFLASQGYQVTNVMGGMSTWKGALS